MNTKQVDCVLELSRTLHFGRAAQRLFISQPALSYQVKALETEVGFQIFERGGSGAVLTPAGAQFCRALRAIRADLKRAVENGQNTGAQFRAALRVGMPCRSALPQLPRAMARFAARHPDVLVEPVFLTASSADPLLAAQVDVLFALTEHVIGTRHVALHALAPSRICLITRAGDALARRERLTADDLAARTLMVGGGSPTALQAVQQRVLAATGIPSFNSHDHDTTLVNVAAGRGVCLAPDFLDDGGSDFAWTPFDCEESVGLTLCTRTGDRRESLGDLVGVLVDLDPRNTGRGGRTGG